MRVVLPEPMHETDVQCSTLLMVVGVYQARMAIPGFNVNFYPREDEEQDMRVWEDEPLLTPAAAPEPAACPVDERYGRVDNAESDDTL